MREESTAERSETGCLEGSSEATTLATTLATKMGCGRRPPKGGTTYVNKEYTMRKWIGLLYLMAMCGAQAERPNIVFILADDMGYGDMACTGGKAPTPHLDSMATNGVLFTDAHTTSSVCSPSRYSLITGRYNWRRLSEGIVWDFAPALLEKDRLTIAGFLRDQGYQTGMVGKWHLGHTWQKLPKGEVRRPTNVAADKYIKTGWKFDYTKRALGGPFDHGFEAFLGISASLDVPPFVYIRDGYAVAVPTIEKTIKPRTGPATEDFDEFQTLPILAKESRQYIRGACERDEPFFLFLSLTSPHNPISPSKRWWGKSPFGRIGDFLMETDWVVGEVLAQLEAEGELENTLIMFSSDNGSPFWSNPQSKKAGHFANGDWRGGKSSVYEGGHRVPFLVQWPARVKGAQTCDSLITLADFFATAADVIGSRAEITDAVAEDSVSFLPDLLGTGTTDKKVAVHHALDGSFAIRKGDWKLIFSPDSGGWNEPKPKKTPERWQTDELFQLHNLALDPGETKNVWKQHPEMMETLAKAMGDIAQSGRTTRGTPQPNNVKHPNGKVIGDVMFPEVYVERFPELGIRKN
jgi:arylsulfatase A